MKKLSLKKKIRQIKMLNKNLQKMKFRKSKTGNIIFTLNEKWHKPEHIQSHIGKAKAAPHFPKFAEAMQYANVSVMGEIFYELKK